ncbi:Predicted arabinose efflux permease, MFS family [Saccharopolyspora antimicrobica]|uniref:MFS family arabinose efflux permease n=1 Tax=Saccharopolyspora antimicrobica TaxID=455193 RepID=A0A1I4TKZ9_9PSEU|nr:MFS transporter [Saccharopolyspora antimicrobica]RKT88454.1 putative MFS family arabinose efflux permease [Saccharopolyspora antimicrobica]SFM77325.1 Predicted arabinose efflux permease, MFS family [Saccharopolyspora antimicrobica]
MELGSNRALPLGALLAFATVVLLGCLTETLPAGVLLPMSADLRVSESQAGQLVAVYAISTAATSVPLTALTRRLPRRALLLGLILGFAVVNAVTALSPWYPLTLVARVLAGAVSGVMWAMIAGYAMRIVPAERAGRALAIAMAGTPIGFALGVPAGTVLGELLGWRYAFGAMSVIAVALVGWVLWQVPPLSGQSVQRRAGIRDVLTTPGFRTVLVMTFALALGHNVLYTYIGPVLADAGRIGLLSTALLVFGLASVLGLWIVGSVVDRRLQLLIRCSTSLVAVAAALIGGAAQWPVALLLAVAVWGVAFGGAPTMFPAAAARIAGRDADLAQSLTITVWNVAIAAGAYLGGAALDLAGSAAPLPWLAAALAAAAFGIAVRRNALRDS